MHVLLQKPLCATCWDIRLTYQGRLRAIKQRWQEEPDRCKSDASFLKEWRTCLDKLETVGVRRNPAIRRMLDKLLKAGDA